jgi:hypothetical protein
VVPPVPRKQLTQARWLRLPKAHPDAAFLRSDAYANMLAVARAVGWSADWETLRSRPTIAHIMQVTNLSRRSCQRWTRWLELRGFLQVIEPGVTPRFRPGITPGDGNNLAREWLLVQPADPCGNLSGAPSLALDFQEDLPAPTRTREDDFSTGPPPWPPGQRPHRRDEIRSAAESLRREHLVLRRISAPALASIARPWFVAGYSVADLLWALEHLPSGHLHRFGASVRFPRAWVAYRLAFWAGHPPHSAELAARAERHRARRVPRRKTGTAPPPAWHQARAEMERRVRFPH